LEIGLDAQHHVAELPIVADLTAADRSGCAEPRPFRDDDGTVRDGQLAETASETDAGVRTEIEAGPIVDLGGHGCLIE
jgi:hypothetical protein